MLKKLDALQYRFEEVGNLIVDPAVISDMQRYVKLNKEYKDLNDILQVLRKYKKILNDIESSKEVLKTEKDESFREMAKAELDELEPLKEKMEEEIRYLLIPKDPEDSKNVIMEIRAGTGGDEASIFAGDLFRMYSKFIETQGWNMEVIQSNAGTAGGFKEVQIQVSGADVYGILKYESGVHRVQRVPDTEAQGRVHTSAATVVVLPEAEEVDVQLNMNEIKKDVFRASGAGGQHVNKTESAVRLTHLPTGIVVECQDGRSQIKNFEKALTVLRSRIYEMELNKAHQERAQQRKTLVSSGDRSAKIRTYNYPQGRVTDHRIGLTLYNLEAIINGDIGNIIEALRMAENAEKLKEGTESI
ncbi:MAG: peptide chain release factor 1 [Bacteroidetes bacterium]|nr:peptide chain release factor 1 [Bacteroidota bacterium]MCL4816200.1 peptide chain release factor 1 [Flavobacteriales bacterium]NOG95086.1 peptide chain release factor 1 [Bacteroidota bacterium]WKZ76689.1 MAG: peptide chain release factor 1 [Vicingaceae bacterium]